MCGIFCILSQNPSYDLHKVYDECRGNLCRRGPDSQNTSEIKINEWRILLGTSVLWLQGDEVTAQPIETDRSWFMFNGDILDDGVLPYEMRVSNGDTLPLLNEIEASGCVDVLRKVQGPYAFIYVDKMNEIIYFGRDIYGRRSLLVGVDDKRIFLSSVASRNISDIVELPAIGIFTVDLRNFSISLYPWNTFDQHSEKTLKDFEDRFEVRIRRVGDLVDRFTYIEPTQTDLESIKQAEHLNEDIFEYLLADDAWSRNVRRLSDVLESAVMRRVTNVPNFCNDCVISRSSCDHSSIGVLFSGGIDCALLTLLADSYVDKSRQIDLINVAFERSNSYDTPDRLTAKRTCEELRTLRPNRRWNLLEINVTKNELDRERNDRIGDLIYPLRTILDESLGCALWFAARGKSEDYISPSRVLLVGMGADELFGGYSRHRAAYKRGSWRELSAELDADWRNISHRNLARDDRVVSDHGRQVRTPYLDEEVVEFVKGLKAWERCYPHERLQGIGDKLLLRTLAYKLGLRNASLLRKRALQFGSRIANSKENAHEISPRI